MRIPIIAAGAVALLLSGAVIVVGAVNYASQNSAPHIEVADLSPSHSVGEYSWSDALQLLYDERQTKITMEAYGIASSSGWTISESGSLTNAVCPGTMEVVGTEGEIQIRRLNCFDLDGKLIGFYEERAKWVVRRGTHEMAIELPPDWPWTPEQIEAGRQLMLEDAASLNMPICPGLYVAPVPIGSAGDPPCLSYPMYLSEEYVTTGKVLVFYGGEITARWEREPCVAEICHESQAWHTVDTATVIAWEQYWKRYSAYCAAIADFNKRLKVVAETDPELAWDPTTYDRLAFKYGSNVPGGVGGDIPWECSLPQLPPTDADWQRLQVTP